MRTLKIGRGQTVLMSWHEFKVWLKGKVAYSYVGGASNNVMRQDTKDLKDYVYYDTFVTTLRLKRDYVDYNKRQTYKTSDTHGASYFDVDYWKISRDDKGNYYVTLVKPHQW